MSHTQTRLTSGTTSFLGVLIAAFAVFFVAADVQAGDPKLTIRDAGYSAQYVSQSLPDPVEIVQGSTKEVVFNFKNNGAKTWRQRGGNHVSAYTVEPKYRTSLFAGPNWISGEQTALIPGEVGPGEVGQLRLKLTADVAPGEYVERFHLAVENHTWMKNGYFFIKIKVVPASKKKIVNRKQKTENSTQDSVVSSESEEVELDDVDDYKVNRFILNKKKIVEDGGEKVKLIIGYQNIGEKTWGNYKIISDSDVFVDESWDTTAVVRQGKEEVEPKGFLRRTIYVRTPEKKGEYVLRLALQLDDRGVDDHVLEIPVTVKKDAPRSYRKPSVKKDKEVVEEKPVLAAEPHIRVGMAATNDFVQFVSYDDDYAVYKGTKKIGVLSKKKIAKISFASGVFSFKGDGISFRGNQHIRLEPVSDERAVFKLMKFERTLSRLAGTNFNEYRGAFEFRRGEVDKKIYVVNEVLLEDYAAGIAETTNSDSIEFIKANLVAARTYAYYNKNKYPFFDVLGNTYDQLYLGYQIEERMPNVKKAAVGSRGRMITYNGQVVTTPYFGNSNGTTRSFHTVWGGKKKPWLVPVKATYDAGRRQYGHGVGMSQRDANIRAKKEGLKYDELLKYYYTGVDVTLMYK